MMVERVARRNDRRGQFRFAAEAKPLIPVSRDFLLAKSHRGLHLLAREERCLRTPVDALRAAYGANVVIERRSFGEPVVEVRIGLEKRSLARVRSALRRRRANPSEEYGGTHYCVLRFEASPAGLLGLPVELAELTSARFSHQILVTGYQ